MVKRPVETKEVKGPVISDNSKKIKKEAKKEVKASKDKRSGKKILEKDDPYQKTKEYATPTSLSEFLAAETEKYRRIRKRTIEKLQVDKELVKKAVKALLKHYNNTKAKNNLLDVDDDFIYVTITLSHVPEKYSIRPIQM
jgi:uncharacterized protein with ATP-grasp and redox domains